jgi:hexosaminidase
MIQKAIPGIFECLILKLYMKKTNLLLALLLTLSATAQESLPLVPAPVSIRQSAGTITVDPTSLLLANGKSEKAIAALFNDYLQKQNGFQLRTASKGLQNKTAISFSISKTKSTAEGYQLTSGKNGIRITGNDAAGLFYGMQTLLQLLEPSAAKGTTQIEIPYLQIDDYPRFVYRGMHLDVARHFASVNFLKRYIDYLAMHKFNTFHWHLTDDQGWRIEIKKYPLLTQIGGCREQTLIGRYGSDKYDGKKYCGYYTQEEIKEVIQYATERQITVIPEIEMPGHALAALSAYPDLGCTKGPYKAAQTWGVFDDVFCAGNDATFNFLENVLSEVIALFPSKLIHIGGDESPKVRWKACPLCQQRIKKENLKDEHQLQSYFITRIEKFVNSKGRNIIGWDEILEGGLAPNATVMSWRGEEGGIEAAKQKHNVIMTPGGWMYFDHSQSSNEDSVTIGGFTPLEKVYGYEPIPAALNAEQAKYILGAQANVWREYITNDKKTEYSIFPRMSALSEVLWSPKSKRNWSDFQARIPSIFERYRIWKANYSSAYYDLQTKVIPYGNNKVAWELKTNMPGGKIVYNFGPEKSMTVNYAQPIEVTGTGELYAALTDSTQVILGNWARQAFFVNKATGKKISLKTNPSKGYAGNGAFSLVDGVQNTMGMNKSAQFLGFSGTDLEAVVDLEMVQPLTSIALHVFEQQGSWIYRPQSVSIFVSNDGISFEPVETISNHNNAKNLVYKTTKPTQARFVKVLAKNAGIIESGKPGAGQKAWLFVDEIVVE